MHRLASALRALGLVALLTAPFGVGAHLLAEFAALRARDALALTTSGRHDGLLALAALGLVGAIAWTLTARGRPRERAEALVAQLPDAGSGPRFVAGAFAAQIGWFALTQLGEGTPILGGDLPAGIAAAFVVACAGAFVIALGKRRLLAVAVALFRFIGDAAAHREPTLAVVPAAAPRRRIAHYFSSLANRPPPRLATVTTQ
jgi:hypothetical protein